MKHRRLLLTLTLGFALTASTHPAADTSKLRTYVQTLASERFGGRLTGTEGEAPRPPVHRLGAETHRRETASRPH